MYCLSLNPCPILSLTAPHLYSLVSLPASVNYPEKNNFPFCSFCFFSENAFPNTLDFPSPSGFLLLSLNPFTWPSGCLSVVADLQANLTQTTCPFLFLFKLFWAAARISSLCALSISFKRLIKLFLTSKKDVYICTTLYRYYVYDVHLYNLYSLNIIFHVMLYINYIMFYKLYYSLIFFEFMSIYFIICIVLGE